VIRDDVAVVIPLLEQTPAEWRFQVPTGDEDGGLDRMGPKGGEHRSVAPLRDVFIVTETEVVHGDGDLRRALRCHRDARGNRGSQESRSQ
jgi:hypothetical protein